jgi:hypothetical protein
MSKKTPSSADKKQAGRMLKKGAPNYRSKNPMRVSEDGKAVYEYADQPQWKKTTYVPSSKAYEAGEGRGDPKKYKEVNAYSNGGLVMTPKSTKFTPGST